MGKTYRSLDPGRPSVDLRVQDGCALSRVERRGEDWCSEVDCLPSMYKLLGLNPSSEQKSVTEVHAYDSVSQEVQVGGARKFGVICGYKVSSRFIWVYV